MPSVAEYAPIGYPRCSFQLQFVVSAPPRYFMSQAPRGLHRSVHCLRQTNGKAGVFRCGSTVWFDFWLTCAHEEPPACGQAAVPAACRGCNRIRSPAPRLRQRTPRRSVGEQRNGRGKRVQGVAAHDRAGLPAAKKPASGTQPRSSGIVDASWSATPKFRRS